MDILEKAKAEFSATHFSEPSNFDPAEAERLVLHAAKGIKRVAWYTKLNRAGIVEARAWAANNGLNERSDYGISDGGETIAFSGWATEESEG